VKAVVAGKRFRWALAFSILFSGSVSSAQSNTPQGALEEMATAIRPEDLLKHLPASLESLVNELPPAQKAAALSRLSLGSGLAAVGFKLHKNDDGRFEVTWDGGPRGTVATKGAFISGVDALVPVEIQYPTSAEPQVLVVGMRFEQGEWRVIEVGPWAETKLEQVLAEKLDPVKAEERQAVRALLQIPSALSEYARTFPERGYPRSLGVLCSKTETENQASTANAAGSQDAGGEPSERESEEQDPEHAGLLEEAFCHEPLILNGYKFLYTVIDSGVGTEEPSRDGTFRITATAIGPGKAGYKNFMVDQSFAIWFTQESRAANEYDQRYDQVVTRIVR
jgi:hypothetical protein